MGGGFFFEKKNERIENYVLIVHLMLHFHLMLHQQDAKFVEFFFWKEIILDLKLFFKKKENIQLNVNELTH